jgi:hypothetical protein
MDQVRVHKALIMVSKAADGEMTHAELLRDLDFEAAKKLAEQHLVKCNVVLLDQGVYRFYWTSNKPLTVQARLLLLNLHATADHKTTLPLAKHPNPWLGSFSYRQGF